MRKNQLAAVSIAALLLGLGLQIAQADNNRHGNGHGNGNNDKPKNIILFIGDGMGVSEVTAARYYYYGARGRMNMDKLDVTGFQTTWSLKPGPGPNYQVDYAPDSASTGTMWATGKKTIDERVSQGPSVAENVPGQNLRTILEVFQSQGKRTGNVSTAEITDATPAVLNSKMSLRGCQAPSNMAVCPTETKAAGGLGSIAEQTVDHKVDVVLGGGRNRFDTNGGLIAGGPDNGKTVLQSAQRQGYKYITTATQLGQLKKWDLPVLGLFTPGNMTTEWTGPRATIGDGVPAHECITTNRPANEPSLADMTAKALQLLDNSRNGFFLQVEGASIDKQDHAANACGQIGETVAFDKAIGVALEYQERNPDTLILVTADHSHTSLIVAEDSSGTGNPTGYSDNLITKDGQVMRMTYGTAGGPGPAPVPPEPAAHRRRGSDLCQGPERRGGGRHDGPHRSVLDHAGEVIGGSFRVAMERAAFGPPFLHLGICTPPSAPTIVIQQKAGRTTHDQTRCRHRRGHDRRELGRDFSGARARSRRLRSGAERRELSFANSSAMPGRPCGSSTGCCRRPIPCGSPSIARSRARCATPNSSRKAAPSARTSSSRCSRRSTPPRRRRA